MLNRLGIGASSIAAAAFLAIAFSGNLPTKVADAATPPGKTARNAEKTPLRRGAETSPPPCAAYTPSAVTFVGIAGQSDIAGGAASSVPGGASNAVCGTDDVVAGGSENIVGPNNQSPIESFIAAGQDNAIYGNSAFIGSGFTNLIRGDLSAIGSGEFNEAEATGSFVGAGGVKCNSAFPPLSSPFQNLTYAADSFVGAGDRNVTQNGSGTFIGAGGTMECGGNTAQGVDSFIGAGESSTVGLGANENFIGAGVENSAYVRSDAGVVGGRRNSSLANDGFIGGGFDNSISGVSGDSAADTSIVGGYDNLITYTSQPYPASGPRFIDTGYVGGGTQNSITAGQYVTIGGGSQNSVTSTGASIGGGTLNSGSGEFATVPGGYQVTAGGLAAFGAGFAAQALMAGSFVWADDTKPMQLASLQPNQFLVRATGGTDFFSNEALTNGVRLEPGSGSWSSLSDRGMKTAISALDGDGMLAKLATLPLGEWSYVSERGVRHVGPMAQDFFAAFRVGEDDRHITTIDEGGVALSAIKALSRRTASADRERRALRDQLASMDDRLDDLDRTIAALHHH